MRGFLENLSCFLKVIRSAAIIVIDVSSRNALQSAGSYSTEVLMKWINIDRAGVEKLSKCRQPAGRDSAAVAAACRERWTSRTRAASLHALFRPASKETASRIS